MNEFRPDWDAMAVMVEEQQRMAKRIAELEAQECMCGICKLKPVNREPVAWRKHYDNSGYTYYDARWKNIPEDAEPLYL